LGVIEHYHSEPPHLEQAWINIVFFVECRKLGVKYVANFVACWVVTPNEVFWCFCVAVA